MVLCIEGSSRVTDKGSEGTGQPAGYVAAARDKRTPQ